MIEGLFLQILHPNCAGLRMTRLVFSSLNAARTEQCLAAHYFISALLLFTHLSSQLNAHFLISSLPITFHCYLFFIGELPGSNIVLYA